MLTRHGRVTTKFTTYGSSTWLMYGERSLIRVDHHGDRQCIAPNPSGLTWLLPLMFARERNLHADHHGERERLGPDQRGRGGVPGAVQRGPQHHGAAEAPVVPQRHRRLGLPDHGHDLAHVRRDHPPAPCELRSAPRSTSQPDFMYRLCPLRPSSMCRVCCMTSGRPASL